MTITTKHLLLVLQVLSWIIFIGVSIEAGGFLFNTIYTFFIPEMEARFYWSHIDLSALFRFDRGYFLVITGLMSIVAVLKATLFYAILKMLHEQKLDLQQPFTPKIGKLIFGMSYLALGIGLFAHWGERYTTWLIGRGIQMPELHHLRLAGADVWLFMGVVLFVIALIFKRGIELQTDSELTV